MVVIHRDTDTIAAVATPSGPGGIGIIRISGSDSLPILKAIFRPSNPNCSFKSHMLYHGFITDPDTGQEIDEALCVYMKAPKTYTRQDVVEIQCHSGPAVMGLILELCLARGARLALPGEFTKRAFLSGRIDLTQAEALNDLVNAQSSCLSLMSVKGLKGGLAERIETIRQGLVYCLSALEVAIDYPEEDSEIVGESRIMERLQKDVIGPVESLIRAYEIAAIHRSGVKVLLVGRPNAGKSSLLNALACEERAIVTEIPGTTRDIVEQQVEMDGIVVTLMDTAGIRQSPDPIEAMGIDKIARRAAETDIFLWLIDPVQGTGREEEEVARLLASHGQGKIIVVINKMDMVKPVQEEVIKESIMQELARMEGLKLDKEIPVCTISAKTGLGLQELAATISDTVLRDKRLRETDVAPNIRQKQVLQRVGSCLERGMEGLKTGLSPDVVALDLRQALDLLGEITGETATEDILDQIFSRFCLGK